MSAKACKGCGRPVFFAKDLATGKWEVLENTAPTWEQLGLKEGVPIVRRSKSLVSHFNTCPKANNFSSSNKPEQLSMPEPEQHFSEPKIP